MSPREVAAALEGPVQSSGTASPWRCAKGCASSRSSPTSQTLDLPTISRRSSSTTWPATRRPRCAQKFAWLSVIPQGKSLEGFLGAGIFDVDPSHRCHPDARHAAPALAGQSGIRVDRAGSTTGQGFLRGGDAGQHRRARGRGRRGAAADRRRIPEPPRRPGRPAAARFGPGDHLRQGHCSSCATCTSPNGRTTRSGRSTTWARPPGSRSPPTLSATRSTTPAACRRHPSARPDWRHWRRLSTPILLTGYLYFVAKNDGSGTHAFARTYAEHQANVRLYRNGGVTPAPSSPSPSA